jgi:hypothetical protein
VNCWPIARRASWSVADLASPSFIANADLFQYGVRFSLDRLRGDAGQSLASSCQVGCDARGRVDDLCCVEDGVGQRRLKGRVKPWVDVKEKIGPAVLAG